MRLHRVLCGCPCLQEQLQLMDAAVRAREADDHANAREDAVAREKAKRKLRMKMKRDFDRLLNNVRIGVLCACVCVCLPLSLSLCLSLSLSLSVCLSVFLSVPNKPLQTCLVWCVQLFRDDDVEFFRREDADAFLHSAHT